jgi:large subunit ribosomal protein L6
MQSVELPEGFEADYDGEILTVSDGDEELEKKLDHALIDVKVEDGKVSFEPLSDRRNVTSVAGTFRAHVENMVNGLQNEHVYRMKGVYAHFPMTVKKQGNEIHIENFMGERADRVVEIMDGVDVEIDGEDIVMRSSDKDAVSQTAARLEQICFKGDRDPRTFQDGVYITEVSRDE